MHMKTLTLTTEIERLLQEKVASGRYQSQHEVLQEALRLLYERDERRERETEELKMRIQQGIDQLENGQSISLTEEALGECMDSIKLRGRQKLENKLNSQLKNLTKSKLAK